MAERKLYIKYACEYIIKRKEGRYVYSYIYGSVDLACMENVGFGIKGNMGDCKVRLRSAFVAGLFDRACLCRADLCSGADISDCWAHCILLRACPRITVPQGVRDAIRHPFYTLELNVKCFRITSYLCTVPNPQPSWPCLFVSG